MFGRGPAYDYEMKKSKGWRARCASYALGLARPTDPPCANGACCKCRPARPTPCCAWRA